MRALVAIVIAACGGNKDSAPSPGSASSSAPAKPGDAAVAAAPPVDAASPVLPACVTATDSFGALRIAGGKLVGCYGDNSKACFAFDPATGAATPHALPPEPETDDGVTVSAKEVTVCKPGAPGSKTDCKTLPPVGDGGSVAVNDDRSLAALVVPAKGVDVVEVATGKKLVTIPGWKTPMSEVPTIYGAQFVGEQLAVHVPFTPISAAVKLFEPRTGKLLGQVGGGEVQLGDARGVKVDGATWVWAGFPLKDLFLHDVTTGKLTGKLELPVKPANDMSDVGHIVDKVGDYVIVAGREVHAINVKTKAASTLAPPYCK